MRSVNPTRQFALPGFFVRRQHFGGMFPLSKANNYCLATDLRKIHSFGNETICISLAGKVAQQRYLAVGAAQDDPCRGVKRCPTFSRRVSLDSAPAPDSLRYVISDSICCGVSLHQFFIFCFEM